MPCSAGATAPASSARCRPARATFGTTSPRRSRRRPASSNATTPSKETERASVRTPPSTIPVRRRWGRARGRGKASKFASSLFSTKDLPSLDDGGRLRLVRLFLLHTGREVEKHELQCLLLRRERRRRAARGERHFARVAAPGRHVQIAEHHPSALRLPDRRGKGEVLHHRRLAIVV